MTDPLSKFYQLFLPRDAICKTRTMHLQVCLSVCLSVSHTQNMASQFSPAVAPSFLVSSKLYSVLRNSS